MNRDTAARLLGRTPPAPGTVRQVAVPPGARALSTLSRIDYEDAFLVDVPTREWTAEQFARAILEDAPISIRRTLMSGWLAIGLKLGGSRSERFVLGWEVRRNTPDFVLLAADSRIGMPGELLFKRQQHTLLFATFVQQDNHLARATWAGVEPVHVQVVRHVLAQRI
jgi:hypothetical protein